MKTKIVYAVVSDEHDTYLEQVIFSAYSARKYNHSTVIEMVVDDITAKTLVGPRAIINNYVNRIIVIPISDEYSKMEKSRYLKTNLRNFIEGDFIFLDSDTIVKASLDELDNIESDLCCVRESNKYDSLRLDGTSDAKHMYKLAASVGLEKDLLGMPYFNSGVIYAKDSPKAHDLYNRWNQCWQSLRKKGLKTDQTALCWANKLEQFPISHFSDSWNSQILVDGINYIKEAKIIHYFYTMGGNECLYSRDFMLRTILNSINVEWQMSAMLNMESDIFLSNSDTILYVRNQRYLRKIFENHRTIYNILQNFARIYLYLVKKIK